MKPALRSLVAGLAWGIIGAGIYFRMPFYALISILIAGPLIGFAVFSLSRWSYGSRIAIAVCTVPSVYFAVALFGLVVGLLDSIIRGNEMIGEDMAFALWGISIPTPFWLLYPLAFVTHLWVRSGKTVIRKSAPVENAI